MEIINSENQQISTWNNNIPNLNIPKIQDAASKGDATAQEVLGLMNAKDDLIREIDKVKKESSRIGSEISQYKIQLEKANQFMIGVVIATAITFVVTTITLYWGEILNNKSDKDLYLKYNEVYKNYSDKNAEQKIQINNLENELNMLKAKNSYLK